MKKLLRFIGVLFALSALCACSTTKNAGSASGTPSSDAAQPTKRPDFIVRGADENPEKLEKNDVMSVTENTDAPVYFEFGSWSKIRIIGDVFDALQLHAELTNEQKYKFMSYLFDELPKNAEDGIVREVRLGRFFSEGKGDAANLVIRVGVFTPGPGATVKNEKVIVIYSNAVKSGNEIMRGSGEFINLDTNATVIATYNNKLLTNINDIRAAENAKVDAGTLTGFDKILYAQSLLKDEDLNNDVKAHDLCAPIIDDESNPALKIMAMLMEYNYRISREDIEGAQAVWNDILAYCVNVPGDMTPENLEAVNGESLHLLRMLKK